MPSLLANNVGEDFRNPVVGLWPTILSENHRLRGGFCRLRYWHSIPVLRMDGSRHAKACLDEANSH